MHASDPAPKAAIACGGTGGHLFPGLAVAEQLRRRGCLVTLLISPKEVDQQGVQSAAGARVATLPAIGLSRGGELAFLRAFAKSYRFAKELFQAEKPEAVLAMGGFTSAPPILAGRALGAATFLHESNTIPGRANRWLSWVVGEAFVGFPEAANRLRARQVKATGTPVRPQFQPADAAECRAALGLEPRRPVLVVTGGSQGASGLNTLVMEAMPLLAKLAPELQLFHLTGPRDVEKVERACALNRVTAVVRPFSGEMHLVLGAASAALSRAGASSLAELAAMRLPAILVPFPAAADNHQHRNALAFEQTGAAFLQTQAGARAEIFAARILELIGNAATRNRMGAALARWHAPLAAEQIADSIMLAIFARRRAAGGAENAPSPANRHRQSALT